MKSIWPCLIPTSLGKDAANRGSPANDCEGSPPFMYLETSLSCTRIQTSASEPTGGFFGLLPQMSNNTASKFPWCLQ